MRWHSKQPRLGDTKTVREFLLLPKTIGDETRWLCWTRIRLRYELSVLDVPHWYDLEWMDDEPVKKTELVSIYLGFLIGLVIGATLAQLLGIPLFSNRGTTIFYIVCSFLLFHVIHWIAELQRLQLPIERSKDMTIVRITEPIVAEIPQDARWVVGTKYPDVDKAVAALNIGERIDIYVNGTKDRARNVKQLAGGYAVEAFGPRTYETGMKATDDGFVVYVRRKA